MLPFSVAAKYARGPERIIASFFDNNDAKAYIHLKLNNDATLKVDVTYLLYDMGELMETFEPGSAGSAGGAGQQQANAFRPSPLQTNLRPTGMPVSNFPGDSAKDDSDK